MSVPIRSGRLYVIARPPTHPQELRRQWLRVGTIKLGGRLHTTLGGPVRLFRNTAKASVVAYSVGGVLLGIPGSAWSKESSCKKT